jgi:hypothetical protein
MSSAVSLVPTTQKSSKKKRPAFRPGAGPRKKTKPTVAKKIPEQPAEEQAAKPDVDNEIQREKEAPQDNEPSRENESPQENAAPKSIPVVVQESLPKEDSTKPDSEMMPPPKAKRATTRRKKIKIASSRMEEEVEDDTVNEAPAPPPPQTVGRPKRKVEAATTAVLSAPQGQNSLFSYCSKFRAAKRPKKKNQPVALPPPPPPPEEDLAPAGPQVKIVDGEIVLQESSMVVPTARKTVQEVEEEYQHVVEEEGHTTIVGASYNSFVTRRKPQHWAVAETKLFYHALRQVGSDFVTMNAFFPNRTRKQLKKKFQRENIKNPHLIQLSLEPRNKLKLDMSIFNVDTAAVKAIEKRHDEEEAELLRNPPPPPVAPVSIDAATSEPVLKPATGEEPLVVEEDAMVEAEEQMQAMLQQKEQRQHVMEQQEPSRRDDIFGDPFDDLPAVEEFSLEQEMAFEQPPAAVIPIAPNAGPATKAKSKRPKFRAGKRKGK